MANEEHLRIINQGVDSWNEWRRENPQVRPNLSGPDLSGADLIGANLGGADLGGADLFLANLSCANLRRADLSGADLRRANLRGADLSEADLSGADLSLADLTGANLAKTDLGKANLRKADLRKADLSEADLSEADLSQADLSRANLSNANLISVNLLGTNLKNAHLSGCRIYGISAWNLKVNEKTKQSDLKITLDDESIITVDNIEVAQFICLLLHNEKIRRVIDTITTKVVLILGRFTPERKVVLDAIREELRGRDYISVLFDFDKPATRDLTETVSTLAHLARFIIADITDPRSIPQELGEVVPNLPSVPIQPLLLEGVKEYGMFEHFKKYPWVLAIHRYKDFRDLVSTLKTKVIQPAEAKVKELREGKFK